MLGKKEMIHVFEVCKSLCWKEKLPFESDTANSFQNCIVHLLAIKYQPFVLASALIAAASKGRLSGCRGAWVFQWLELFEVQ